MFLSIGRKGKKERRKQRNLHAPEGMPLKTWQYALSFIVPALGVSWCVYFLASAHTKIGGEQAGGWTHRTLMLVLAAIYTAQQPILVWSLPKRQVFFSALAGSVLGVVGASDTMCKCVYVHLGLKTMGAVVLIVVLASIRKMAARLAKDGGGNVGQLTLGQKVFFVCLVLNCVVLMVAPSWKGVWGVIEITLLLSVLAEAWVHFVKFERTAKDAFGQVGTLGAPGSAPGGTQSNSLSDQNRRAAAKRVGGAKKNLGRNVRLMFLFCHLVVLGGLVLNPLWPSNSLSSVECQVRSVWDLLVAMRIFFLDYIHLNAPFIAFQRVAILDPIWQRKYWCCRACAIYPA